MTTAGRPVANRLGMHMMLYTSEWSEPRARTVFERAKTFGYDFVESNERNGDDPPGPLLSISEYRGVELNTRTDGQQASLDVSKYRVVRPGQLGDRLIRDGVRVDSGCGGIGGLELLEQRLRRVDGAIASGLLNPGAFVHLIAQRRHLEAPAGDDLADV